MNRVQPTLLLALLLTLSAVPVHAGDNTRTRLRSTDHELRLRGLDAFRQMKEPVPGLIDLVFEICRRDSHPQVRSRAFRAIRCAGYSRRAQLCRESLPRERDHRAMVSLLGAWELAHSLSAFRTGEPQILEEDAPGLLLVYLRPPAEDDRQRERVRKSLWPLLVHVAPPDVLPGRRKQFRRAIDKFPSRLADAPPTEARVALSEWWEDLCERGVYLPEDVPALERTLADPKAGKRKRVEALCGLAWIGTEESLSVIDRFNDGIRGRRPGPHIFSEETIDHPSFGHFAPWTPEILAECEESPGKRWALVTSPMFGWRVLSLVPGEGEGWGSEIPTGVHHPDGRASFKLEVSGDEARIRWVGKGEDREPDEETVSLAALLIDSDKDGFTDVVEGLLGLDAGNPDTDGDEVPDGEDPFPGIPPAPLDGASEARQALWAAVLGTGRGPGQVVALGHRVRPPQSYWGYGGPVIGRNDALDRISAMKGSVMILTDFKLEIDGDRAEATLADYEGPEAAGSFQYALRKIRGRWYVTAVLDGVIA